MLTGVASRRLSFSVGVFSVADSGVALRALLRCLSEARNGSTITVRVFLLLFLVLEAVSGLRRAESFAPFCAGEGGT